jgi:glycosyltransferase involved in cell wall biosynthesis
MDTVPVPATAEQANTVPLHCAKCGNTLTTGQKFAHKDAICPACQNALFNCTDTSVDKPCVLLINDEWASTKGGISRFNRSLATAMAAAGHHTSCLVETASQREREDAKQRGVELIAAECTPDGPQLLVPAESVLDAKPAIVVGHDVITGSIAFMYAKNYLSNAKLIHIVHTAPAQNEPYKRIEEAAHRTELKEKLLRAIAKRADMVAAVGPLLTRRTEAVVGDAFGGKSVLHIEPGMDLPDGHSERRRSIPANATIMMLCRTEHVEPKGLDIAARAVAGLKIRHGGPAPELMIRGADAAKCDKARTDLLRIAKLARDQIIVRPFTDNPDQIAHDLWHAALCVMPSRVEGYGLAALEAIGMGTPVLVSSKSGFAETLRNHLGPLAEPMIVEVADDRTDVPRWNKEIQRVLDDLPGHFTYTHDVRSRLSQMLRWDFTVKTLMQNLMCIT